LLSQIGLDPERIEMFNLSSAMAGAFVEAAMQMTDRIVELGPNPLRDWQQAEEDQNHSESL
jgi:coenzyme F420-reducing hydrogenase delta subunit